jgi:hypothetical protein
MRGGTPGLCNRLFWKGPFEGLAAAGGPPVLIEGFAARTVVEVVRPGTDEFFGADRLDLSDRRSSLRRFRWRTNVPGVIAGELQLATDRFPVVTREGGACGEPESGIAYRKLVPPGEEQWADTGEIDLDAALRPTRADWDPSGLKSLRTLAYEAVVRGAPVYARVVPITADGPACEAREDGVPGWAVLAALLDLAGNVQPELPDIEAGPDSSYLPPFFDPAKPYSHPYGDQSAYVVVKDHTLPTHDIFNTLFDPLGWKLVDLDVWESGTVLHPDGTYFWIDPGEGSWWSDLTDSVGSLVTGALDSVGFLVDSLANAWQAVKGAVKDVIVEAINSTGIIDCTDNPPKPYFPSCEDLVEYGMDTALASAGIPPTLPNWNSVKQMGIDYAAAEIASQTGLPPSVTEYAAHQIAEHGMDLIDGKRGGKDPRYDWVEPYFGTDPAVLAVSISKTDGDLPGGLVLSLGKSDLFGGVVVPVPQRFAGTILIPIVLPPNVEDVPPPVCAPFGVPVPCSKAYTTRWYRNHFRQKVEGAQCAVFHAFTWYQTGNLHLTPPPSLQLEYLAVVPAQSWSTWGGTPFIGCQ